jgi:hypothetical protein
MLDAAVLSQYCVKSLFRFFMNARCSSFVAVRADDADTNVCRSCRSKDVLLNLPSLVTIMSSLSSLSTYLLRLVSPYKVEHLAANLTHIYQMFSRLENALQEPFFCTYADTSGMIRISLVYRTETQDVVAVFHCDCKRTVDDDHR